MVRKLCVCQPAERGLWFNHVDNFCFSFFNTTEVERGALLAVSAGDDIIVVHVGTLTSTQRSHLMESDL